MALHCHILENQAGKVIFELQISLNGQNGVLSAGLEQKVEPPAVRKALCDME